MSKDNFIKSYIDQVGVLAIYHNVNLIEAYKLAGVHTSTYYRNVNGASELQFETAERIAQALLTKYGNIEVANDGQVQA